MQPEVVVPWEESLRIWPPPRDVVVVIGGVDSGKSYWIRAYCQRYADADIGLVSGDLGQVLFGVPGLISYAPFRKDQPDIETYFPETCAFVGQTHPNGRFLQTIEAIFRVVTHARRRHTTVLVDTDGLIADSVGREYKRLLIMMCRPCSVVLLAHPTEVAPWQAMLAPLEGVRFLGVRPSDQVRSKSASERAHRRHRMFQRWFQETERHIVPIDALLLSESTGLGEPVRGTMWETIVQVLGDRVIYAERSGRTVRVLTREPLTAVAYHRLREVVAPYTVTVRPLITWRRRLIGDIGPDGFASGMGRIVGWSHLPPVLEVEGRFFRTPGPVWIVGTGTFPEVG